jgi:inner membrane protein
MPSPVGHFIGGVAAGWLIAGAPRTTQVRHRVTNPALWREAIVFGTLGVLPDLDLLYGAHRTATHSVGAAFTVGVLAAIVWWLRRGTGKVFGIGAWRFASACAAACASHALLDWLGHDTSAPFGIMALWPFSTTYYESGLHLFPAISRRYHQGWTFIEQNVRAVGLEVAILAPILLLMLVFRRRFSRGAH